MEAFSVWAMPPAEVSEKIKGVMQKLNSTFRGPEFEPHMTVVGACKMNRAQALSCLESACKNVSPYKCKIDRVASGSFFYQCVFALVQKTPEAVQAHLQASRSFGNEVRGEDYMPHISLLYANIDQTQKEFAINNVLSQEDRDFLSSVEFSVSSLCLWLTDTEDESLSSWQKIAELPLSNKSSD
eukprot:TRINITY_DN1698_c0_g1_i2.p1 TRINITY_DN1698_c0_g1~~TRINITY_DN1698_c0_g1_i2.p1  ORF type:complete len:184 (-),score=25.58 TRINITY_DN1698_c0_g1_i2:351-902(-)